MIGIGLRTRPAVFEDRQSISNLIFFEAHIHRHLDWYDPLDWLGHPYFWVLEKNSELLAALACPLDASGSAWIRFFAHNHHIAIQDAWSALWHIAHSEIAQQGGAMVAAIARQAWLNDLLTHNGFHHMHDLVMLAWRHHTLPPDFLQPRADIRPMKMEDVSHVVELDTAAFPPLWRNSEQTLAKALAQAQFATVLEDAHGLAGYQISTGNPFGAHLARLAVRPDAQRQGFGTALVQDVIRRLDWRSGARLTVNTQSDNFASLALYQKLGFLYTGEKYPVQGLEIPPTKEAL
ncbi:MAG: hypothetical protein Fur0043_10790 [Anaerolineales bacterium]